MPLAILADAVPFLGFFPPRLAARAAPAALRWASDVAGMRAIPCGGAWRKKHAPRPIGYSPKILDTLPALPHLVQEHTGEPRGLALAQLAVGVR